MIPNEVFHKVKDTANVKEVWDKLKGEFEGKLRSVLVELGRNFQMTRCSEDDDVCAHFSKLAHLRESRVAIVQIARGITKVRFLGSHIMYDSDSLLLLKDIFTFGSGKQVVHAGSCQF